MAKTTYIDVEQQVITLIIQDNSLMSRCGLSARDFSLDRHIQIFDVMENLDSQGKAVDVIYISEELEKKHGDSQLPYLVELFEKCVASPKSLEQYCKLIKRASKLRAVRNIALEMQYEVENGEDDSFVDTAIQALMNLEQGNQSYESTLKQSLASALLRLDDLHKNPRLPGITTGIPKLDEALGGFRPQKLYVFAGRPGKGKSALMMNFVNALLAADIPSLVFSLEMERDELADRLISIRGSINSHKMTTAKFDDEDWARLSGAVVSMQDRPLTIVDQPNIPIIQMMRAARRIKQRDGIQAVFVDYIQIVGGTSNRQTTLERITEVTLLLKQMARELKVPVIALAQLKREADALDKPAGMSYLADASAIEKDADFIGTLYASESMEAQNQLIIHTCKNRGGPKGDIPTKYERSYYRVTGYGAATNG